MLLMYQQKIYEYHIYSKQLYIKNNVKNIFAHSSVEATNLTAKTVDSIYGPVKYKGESNNVGQTNTEGYIEGQETLSDDELIAKALIVAQSKIEEKNKQISEMQPKVEYNELRKQEDLEWHYWI